MCTNNKTYNNDTKTSSDVIPTHTTEMEGHTLLPTPPPPDTLKRKYTNNSFCRDLRQRSTLHGYSYCNNNENNMEKHQTTSTTQEHQNRPNSPSLILSWLSSYFASGALFMGPHDFVHHHRQLLRMKLNENLNHRFVGDMCEEKGKCCVSGHNGDHLDESLQSNNEKDKTKQEHDGCQWEDNLLPMYRGKKVERVHSKKEEEKTTVTKKQTKTNSAAHDVDAKTKNNEDLSNDERPTFQMRTHHDIMVHFLMEIRMLCCEWKIILFGLTYQWVHSVFTNLVYYQHATILTAAERLPLSDMAFRHLPRLTGTWWMISEYIFLAIILSVASSVFGILFFRYDANSLTGNGHHHKGPLYAVQILRRMLLTLICCQTLRIISFMVTALPGASRQCLYTLPDSLKNVEDLTSGLAPQDGNPQGWAPPKTWFDILFRIDATNGCGDLMFSSHTIFTVLFVCIAFKYFSSWKKMKVFVFLLQIIIVPFILASRKHYSVDVFTALYVTPLVFEILYIHCPDRHTSSDLDSCYGLKFHLRANEQHKCLDDISTFVVEMYGQEFLVDAHDVPIDLVNEKKVERSIHNHIEEDQTLLKMSGDFGSPSIV